MKVRHKKWLTVEHHALELPYAKLRLPRRGLQEKLVASIDTHGQLIPVVIVPRVSEQWMLIDGYLRVNALRRLGIDTVSAEVWECEASEALLTFLMERPSRRLETLEEALLLQELHVQHGYSQTTLATRMGRDQSWVSRRLSLLDGLSDAFLSAIIEGKLSLWSATRILGPMARAIPTDAEKVLQYVITHAVSTRDLKAFYDHYQTSSKTQRANMVTNPELFFKAQKLCAMQKEADRLRVGPEGKWQSELRRVRNALMPLIPLVSELFRPQQEKQERLLLLEELKQAHAPFYVLTESIRNLTHVES
jgi:ParB family transcriptional regulator, chromosome partitioning protein